MNTYKIYGVYEIGKNTEMTKDIMVEAEIQFHLKYATHTAETIQMKDHFDLLTRLLKQIDTESSMKSMAVIL